MQLRAIWGIGGPAYTLDVYGTGQHEFDFHYIVTRTGGFDVIDTCMQLDEDGDPDTLPGTPGWNIDRPWAGPSGYKELSCSNNPTKYLQQLPDLL